MAPDGACGVAHSIARSNAEFDAERFRKNFERDSARNANVLSNPTTSVRAPAPRANAGAAFASVAEHEKACASGDFERQVASRHARAVLSNPQWLQSTAEQ